MQNLPVHHIDDFLLKQSGSSYYVNTLREHIRKHHFITKPHKHDFYVCIVFTKGRGTHTIDFTRYKVKPGSIFFLSPGQVHTWSLSADAEGYVFFHSENFYDLQYNNRRVRDFSFYTSIYNQPVLHAGGKELSGLVLMLKQLLTEYETGMRYRNEKICSLVDVIYIELERLYHPVRKIKTNNSFLEKVRKLERLIDEHHRETKSVSAYARMLNITRKHLNRICMVTLKKTASEMIAGRILLEARRMLMHPEFTVAQVADELGYEDHSYFNRFFRKNTGQTPLQFAEKHR